LFIDLTMREWLYGRNPVYEALRAGRRRAHRLRLARGVEEKGRLQEIVQLCESASIPIKRVARQELETVSPTHQGAALETDSYPYASLIAILEHAAERGEPPFILLLDALQDPQNLGALIRTAEAVGVHGLLLPLRRTATVTPAVVNASSGASEHLLIAQANLAQSITALKKENVWVIGLDAGRESQLPGDINLDGALALVVGSEGGGMRRLVRESCDLLMRLPMRGQVESLNAAAAGSIALYLAWQARGFSR
jgi:23S rRNA (guanosine2251-2'-O)-methyltransferase